MKTKRNNKLFLGRSPLLVEQSGKIKDFYVHASNEGQGATRLRHRMNKERGCVPQAAIPSLEVTEVAEEPRR